MEKYYVLFYTKIRIEGEKPSHSSLKVFSRTRKERKKGYACMLGFFENRNKAVKAIGELGIHDWNTMSSINSEDKWDQEIERDIHNDFVLIDLLNAQKLNRKIRIAYENSAEGKKFKKDWFFLSAKYD